jgi:mevalonate kinase
MSVISVSAPGKIILFGEHAVVYSQPAIAIPVQKVRAKVKVSTDPQAPPGQITFFAPDIAIDCGASSLPSEHPFRLISDNFVKKGCMNSMPAVRIHIHSSIPIASGLGSGAAVSVAIIRGLSSYFGCCLSDKQVSDLAYESEKIYHGNPSGIDNTVIAYDKAVYFIRGSEMMPLIIKGHLSLVIADCGIKSETIKMVTDLQKRFQSHPSEFHQIFNDIGKIVRQAREIFRFGSPDLLGPLMTQNHFLLQKLEVSCKKLDILVNAALSAGALGAKLSGAGGGGNMIALVKEGDEEKISRALLHNGAVRTIMTSLSPEN